MNKQEVDILSVDQEIIDNFKKEQLLLSNYKERLNIINKSINEEKLSSQRILPNLLQSKKELECLIDEIESEIKLNFYKTETAEILDKYRDIMNKPVKTSFMGPSKPNKEKRILITEYLKIASNYTDVDQIQNKKEVLLCKNCGNRKDFDLIDTNIYVCCSCSARQVILKNVSSYRDIDRVNGTARYTYVRRVHFRDAINQYQAKQNSSISDDVYEKLEQELERHGLVDINYDKSDKKRRYKSVTKEHVRIFLQELSYTKHYENINLIHYTITGRKPDDISHLEEKLLHDFDTLTDLYDRLCKDLDRKSFINTQYVLYQLLMKHKHKCNKEDFAILKTLERKTFHNDICAFLFSQLNWSFTSL